MTRAIRRVLLFGVIAFALGVRPSVAESRRTPLPPDYVAECGSCHVTFRAQTLDAASWTAVLAGLDQHFGSDATLDPQALESIRAYLERSARSHPTRANERPLLRISETRWFRGEHDEVPARLWQAPDAVRPADCAACHRDAAQGSYSERSLRLPKKGATR